VWMRGCVVRRVHAHARLGNLCTSSQATRRSSWTCGYAPTLDLYYPIALSLPLSSSVASSPTFSVTTDWVGRRFLQDQRTRGQHRPFEVLVKVRVCAGPTP
jgi:hypothetical protein